MDAYKSQNIALLALFAVISILLFFIFAPFLSLLCIAAVFAFLLRHPYEKLVHDMGGRRSAAATFIVVLTLLFCIVPLFILGTQIFAEAQTMYAQAPGGGLQYVTTVQNDVLAYVHRFYPSFTFNAQLYVGNVLGFISNNLAGLVSGTVYLVFETFLMLLAFFFFLRDGKELTASFVHMSPLGKSETDEIFKNIYQTVNAILRGTIFVAIVRWVLVGFAFYFFGIPNAILWGSIGGIVGAIPGLGTLLVFIPAVLYLYLQGHIFAAMGLSVFCVVVIALVDNVLTTYFFSRGLEVPQIFVLFSILGGVLFFGPIGFIMGPLVFSIFISILHIYSASNKELANK